MKVRIGTYTAHLWWQKEHNDTRQHLGFLVSVGLFGKVFSRRLGKEVAVPKSLALTARLFRYTIALDVYKEN